MNMVDLVERLVAALKTAKRLLKAGKVTDAYVVISQILLLPEIRD